MQIKSPLALGVTHMCPACGNLFFEDGIESYSCFGADLYSDGSSANPALIWVTKCPKCKQYVSKKHLFRLPMPVYPEEQGLGLHRYPAKGYAAKVLAPERAKHYGRLGNRYAIETTVTAFWESVLTQGLYFPLTVSEEEKRKCICRVLRELWQCYNRHRDSIEDDRYTDVCQRLISMLDAEESEDCLTLAELYRNIGEFKKSRDCLHRVRWNAVAYKKFSLFVDRIEAEIAKKNPYTVHIPQRKPQYQVCLGERYCTHYRKCESFCVKLKKKCDAQYTCEAFEQDAEAYSARMKKSEQAHEAYNKRMQSIIQKTKEEKNNEKA